MEEPEAPAWDAAASAPTTHVSPETFADAWRRHERAVRAVELREVQPLNVDVILVAAQVQRVAGRLAPYRERLLLELSLFDAAWVDDLASLARAAMWAGMGVKAVGRPVAHAAALITKARVHRQRLAAALASKAASAEQPGPRRLPRLTERTPAHHAVVLQGLVMALRA